MTSHITALVVSHRGGSRLDRCLRALSRQQPPADQLLVVVSHRSEVAAAVRGRWPAPVEVVTLERPGHFAESVNRGLATVRGELLVVLNDDTVPQPGFLAALREAALAGPPGLYQPCILLQGSEGRLDNAGHAFFFDGLNLARGRNRPPAGDLEREGSLGAVSGAAFLVHTRVMRALGGFDAGFTAYGEDADLSLRALRRGYALRYVPEARVEHALGATYGRTGTWKIFLVERNRVRLAFRSLPWPLLWGLPAGTVLRWLLQTRALVADGSAAAGAPRMGRAAMAAVAGVAAGYAGIPRALARRRVDARAWCRGDRHLAAHLWRSRPGWRDLAQPPPI